MTRVERVTQVIQVFVYVSVSQLVMSTQERLTCALCLLWHWRW